MKNKKVIIGIIVTVIVLVAGFGGFKAVQAENLKKDIAAVKEDLSKYDTDAIKYLKDKKLVNDENIKLLDQIDKDVKLEKSTNKTLSILNDDKTKFDTLDKELVTSLTKKVTDEKANTLKTVKDLKAKTSSEKKTKTTLTTSITNLVVAKDVKGLIANLKALDSNVKTKDTLKATINKRVTKEKASKIGSATSSSSYSNYGYSNNYSNGSSSSGSSSSNYNSGGSSNKSSGSTGGNSSTNRPTDFNLPECKKWSETGANKYCLAY